MPYGDNPAGSGGSTLNAPPPDRKLLEAELYRLGIHPDQQAAVPAEDDSIALLSEDAWDPSQDAVTGLPSAAERAQTWQQWNAKRQGVRRLRGLGELGFTQLPNQRMVAPGGRMTGQEQQMYGQTPLEQFRRMQGQLPSINAIASPGTY